MTQEPSASVERVRGAARNAAWNVSQTGVTALAAFFMTAYALRVIGVAEFGTYVLLTSLRDLLTIADWGLAVGIVRAVAVYDATSGPDRDEARRDVEVGQTVYMGLGAVMVLATVVLVGILPHLLQVPSAGAGTIALAVGISGCGAALTMMSAPILGVATGRRDYRLLFAASAAGVCGRLVVLLSLGPSLRLIALVVAQLVGLGIERLILVVWVMRDVRWLRLWPGRVRRGDLRRLGSYAVPMFVFSITLQVITTSEALIVGGLLGAAAVSLYRVGTSFPLQALGIWVKAASVGFPVMAGAQGKEEQEGTMRFVGVSMTFIAGLGFGLVGSLRNDLVQALLGQPNEAASNVLLLFSLSVAIDAAVHCPTLVMIARGKLGRLALFNPIEVSLNVGLTYALVGRMGLAGSAVATLGTAIVRDLMVFPWLAKGQFRRGVVGVVLAEGVMPALAGCAIAVCVTWLLAGLHPPALRVLVTCGVATLIGVGLGYGSLGSGGREMVRSAFKRQAAPGDASVLPDVEY